MSKQTDQPEVDEDDAIQVDGGDPTPEEARLSKELDDEAGGTPAAASADDDATTDAAAKSDHQAESAADDAGDDAADDDNTAASEAASAPEPQPAPKPEAAKDFDAEFQTLDEQLGEAREKFEAGDLDDDAWAKAQKDNRQALRDLSREEGDFRAQVAVWEAGVRAKQTAAEQDFASAASAWEEEHKEFMDNPIRANAMQQALAAEDKKTGGKLAPQELMQRAEKIAFEAFGYTAPDAPAGKAETAKDDQAKIDAATKARKPKDTPQTLGTAPSTSPMQESKHTTFNELDDKDIDSLEDSLARMSDAQIDAYLRDAPGATATGQ